MSWLFELYNTQPVGHPIGALAFVCVLGMALGGLKLRRVGLGTAGVLFAGIVVEHFGNPVDRRTLDFVKEFGLVLFVFTLGLQLGPGFFAAVRQRGLRLNLLAAVVVLLGSVNSNFACREFGIALFFAAVGLEAGGKFFTTAFSAIGLQWLLAGLFVTVLPLALVGICAGAIWKMNFMDRSGLLAGSMTNPPGLALASNLACFDAPNVAYATVYPLTTFLRILSAQVLAIVLFR